MENMKSVQTLLIEHFTAQIERQKENKADFERLLLNTNLSLDAQMHFRDGIEACEILIVKYRDCLEEVK